MVSIPGGRPASTNEAMQFSLWAGWVIPYHTAMGLITYIAYITGGFIFLGSAAAQVYARLRLRPSDDPDLDEVYHEFEEQDPAYARYNRWLTVTNAGVALGMFLIFVGVVF